jgi:Tfp pilus assembly protein PilV
MNGIQTPVRRRAGFSLIEVALALIVAAGGMLAIFGVFPISLRQSQNSRSDMGEMTFASTVLQTLAGNIRAIDRIDVWNDPGKFWDAAVGTTGLPKFSAATTSARMKELHDSAKNGNFTTPFSPLTTYVAQTWEAQSQDEVTSLPAGKRENIWYFGAEETETPELPADSKIAKPAHYLIRLAAVRRRVGNGNVLAPDTNSEHPDSRHPGERVWAPNVYVISVVSTDRGFPDVYIREPLYSQEFTFVHRP